MNTDRPTSNESQVRVTGDRNYGYAVEEWIGNQLCGAWHDIAWRFERRTDAEAYAAKVRS